MSWSLNGPLSLAVGVPCFVVTAPLLFVAARHVATRETRALKVLALLCAVLAVNAALGLNWAVVGAHEVTRDRSDPVGKGWCFAVQSTDLLFTAQRALVDVFFVVSGVCPPDTLRSARSTTRECLLKKGQ